MAWPFTATSKNGKRCAVALWGISVGNEMIIDDSSSALDDSNKSYPTLNSDHHLVIVMLNLLLDCRVRFAIRIWFPFSHFTLGPRGEKLLVHPFYRFGNLARFIKGLFSLRKRIEDAVLRAETMAPTALELEEAKRVKQLELIHEQKLWEDLAKSNEILDKLAVGAKVLDALKDLTFKISNIFLGSTKRGEPNL